MDWRERWKHRRRSPAMRHLLFALGWLLILLSPLVGLLPGPGGVFVLAAGLALVLETSAWAKRFYVRFKRRWPGVGRWTDRGLRRASERRRRERARRVSLPAAVPAGD